MKRTDKLLTPDEVAEWLGVKTQTLAQWRTVNRGKNNQSYYRSSKSERVCVIVGMT